MAEHSILKQLLLKPLASIYGAGVKLRNLMFNSGIFKEKVFPVPVICVGNIRVGGTGKTPMIEYLLRLLLQNGFKPAVVSRGYKRSTKGLKIASIKSGAEEVGDEPRQIKRKFPQAIVAVDPNRRRAIKFLLDLPEENRPNVILLDDGFQHRYVKPSLSILLTDYNNPIFDDDLLPLGRLREKVDAKDRADMVIVTRCPNNMPQLHYRIFERDLNLFPYQHLNFTTIGYSTPIKVFPTPNSPIKLTVRSKSCYAISGIADPTKFFEELRNKIGDVKTITFPDHHKFTVKDAEMLNSGFDEYLATRQKEEFPIAICTEKDAQRLHDIRKYLSSTLKERLFFLPIHIKFKENGQEKFDNEILKHIAHFQNK